MPTPTHHFFIDETGDHGLTYVDPNFPVFLLVGCLISVDDLVAVENNVKLLKREIFGSDGVILHSSDIRRHEGPFQVLFDHELKQRFYERLNQVMGESSFRIVAVGLDKSAYIKNFGLSGEDPYAFCLTQLMMDMVRCLSVGDGDSKVQMMIERRGRKEDAKLVSHYNRIMDKGTGIMTAEEFKNRVIDLDPRSKLDNIIGLQLADLCAYPLARHLLRPTEPYPSYGVIADKVFRADGVECHECGFQVFP